jgi:hypothetical protein
MIGELRRGTWPLVTIQPSTFRAQEKVLDADGRVELQLELLLSPAALTQWIQGNTTAGNSDGELSILLWSGR